MFAYVGLSQTPKDLNKLEPMIHYRSLADESRRRRPISVYGQQPIKLSSFLKRYQASTAQRRIWRKQHQRLRRERKDEIQGHLAHKKTPTP